MRSSAIEGEGGFGSSLTVTGAGAAATTTGGALAGAGLLFRVISGDTTESRLDVGAYIER